MRRGRIRPYANLPAIHPSTHARPHGLMLATEMRMARAFRTLPGPVLEGKTKEAYFNENYERLAPTPSYIWFQCAMVLDVQAEKPLPTFRQALMKPEYSLDLQSTPVNHEK